MAEVLVIGGGSRECALVSRLSRSSDVHMVTVCPGNAGTHGQDNFHNKTLNVKDHNEVVLKCEEWGVDLVVIGPEDPLADGLADSLRKADINVFGPSKEAAQIESSKAWSKEFMKRHSIPTAKFDTFNDAKAAEEFIEKCDWNGFAIKTSGLAGGKGVIVANDKSEATEALAYFRDNDSEKIREAADTILIEEKLTGFEISVLAFSDGKTICVMPPAQDHKARFAGSLGPNTGGMGAYSPCQLVSKDQLKQIEEEIIQKTIDEMRNEGYPYVGVLYTGLMMTADGPKVLEYNCRFGDPETQLLMQLLSSDLYKILKSCSEENLDKTEVSFYEDKFSVCVCVVVKNYPGNVKEGQNKPIKGLDLLKEDCEVFLGGAKCGPNDDVLTGGGRVLSVCVCDNSLEEASRKAMQNAALITFEGAPAGFEADFRGDIGFQAIKKKREQQSPLLNYRTAGVNINEGYQFIKRIVQFTKQTTRPGVLSELGMFGAVFDTKLAGYNDPLLVSGTDGVGTKLKIAIDSNNHETIGQDLVAMCVNDILVHGAEPLFFLDYLATGKLDAKSQSLIIKGIAKACFLAKCSLVGGETAEMPGMYQQGDYDLAGFAVGAVEKGTMLPKFEKMKAGDVLIGIASSGLHSNGFSLVRKVLHKLGVSLNSPAPFNPSCTLAEELLKPTHLYTSLLPVLRGVEISAAAHITGGGLEENVMRIIPKHFAVQLEASWKIPSVFSWLASMGISASEMLRTFNLGIGMVLVTDARHKVRVMQSLQRILGTTLATNAATYPPNAKDSQGGVCWEIGKVVVPQEENKLFSLTGLEQALLREGSILWSTFPNTIQFHRRKRVAVLISGSGTNLQALLNHTLSGPSAAEIAVVISNISGAGGLERAAKANVPTVVISHTNFPNRKEFDAEVDKTLRKFNIEVVCLAGFMRILTGWFVRQWEGRLINIHPSLLPSFKGKDAQKQAIDAGVCVSGCTAHFVTEDVDAGAIIVQGAVGVHPTDTVEDLSERIKQTEHDIYPKALEMVVREKVAVSENGQRIFL